MAGVRQRVGARRLRRHVRAAVRRRPQTHVPRAPEAHLHRTPPRRSRCCGSGPARSRARGDSMTLAGHARRRASSATLARRARACRLGERKDGRAASTGAPQLVFPGLRNGEQLRAHDGCRRGRRSRPATAPRSPRARSGLSDARTGRGGHRRDRRAAPPDAARRSCAARGVPADAQVGPDRARARVRRPLCRHPRRHAARRRPRARARASAGAGRSGAHDDRPAGPARRGRGARRPLRRDRGDAPEQRRGARAGRHRPVGAPAARARRSRSSRSPACSTDKVAKRSATLPVPDRGDARGRRAPERQRRVLRRLAARSRSRTPATRVFAPLGAKLGREGPRRDRREVRLQRGPGLRGRGALDDPRRGRDRRRPRGRLDARSARARCSPRRCRWREVAATIGDDGMRRQPTLLKGAATPHMRRRLGRDRPHDRELHAHRGHRRHRRRRGDPGREGGGQDRHGRAAHDGQARPDAGRRDPNAAAAAADTYGHRRLVRRLRPAAASRASPSRCCWSARAPAGDTAAAGRPRQVATGRARVARVASSIVQRRAMRPGRVRRRGAARRCAGSSGRFGDRRRRELEQRAARPGSDRSPARVVRRAVRTCRVRSGCGVVGERVELAGRAGSARTCCPRVDDLEVVRRRQRLAAVVLDAHPDAEPDLVAGRVLRGPGGQARQVLLVLGVVRVQVARELDLVLQRRRRRPYTPSVSAKWTTDSLSPQPATTTGRRRAGRSA